MKISFNVNQQFKLFQWKKLRRKKNISDEGCRIYFYQDRYRIWMKPVEKFVKAVAKQVFLKINCQTKLIFFKNKRRKRSISITCAATCRNMLSTQNWLKSIWQRHYQVLLHPTNRKLPGDRYLAKFDKLNQAWNAIN